MTEAKTYQFTFSKAKAVAGAIGGFIAPGVGYLIAEWKGDGIQSGDFGLALLLCLAGGAAVGGAVYKVRNKVTSGPLPPADEGDPSPYGRLP
jgi:hypothetical protein